MSRLRPVTPGEISDLVIKPVLSVSVVFYDQRIRREGFEIEGMMNAAGMNAPVVAEAPVALIGGAESGEQPA